MPDDPRSDAALFRAAQQGDAAAFETLYRRHRDTVVRWALRHGADHATALDVLQETFLYLLRNLGRLRAPDRLTTLLYPAVRHNTLAALRHARRTTQADPPEQATRDPEPDELAALLTRLPDDQREALMLRYVDGFTVPQIAAATGQPQGTIKSRLSRAIAALRADPATRDYFE